MTIEESQPIPTSDHILDWLEESISFLPSFLDDPYNQDDINNCQWWSQAQDVAQDLINANASSPKNPTRLAISNNSTSTQINNSNHSQPPELSRKRKNTDYSSSKPSQTHQQKRNQSRKVTETDNSDGTNKRSVKKGTGKGNGNNGNNGNKEGRWAEHLLYPCAAAITAGDLSRVQHFLYVLHELASTTGDTNHRLAAYGLRALKYHLASTAPTLAGTFASTEPKFFQQSLMRFNEVSPWFAFPNSVANTSILQLLAEVPKVSHSILHILDIGVSHGVQWPTLLESLTRLPGGPPSLVRLTVIAGSTVNGQNTQTPFSKGPPGVNFASPLLSFAKSMNINLEINRLDNQPLQTTTSQMIKTSPDETLIICAQFRLHQLNHNFPDERTEFLRLLRNMEPKGVILSENNMDCSCSSCGKFDTTFCRRVEYLWRFLDSTSSAFKGRESEERKLMEGEAAKALIIHGEMNEGKEKWCERMKNAGFTEEMFGEDAIDGARALLRKYDSNWEMKADKTDTCIGLWWKGQPVSFCSFWKLDSDLQNG